MCKFCDNTGYTWNGGLCHCFIGQEMAEKAQIASDARRDAFNDALDKMPLCPECRGTGRKSVYVPCPQCGGMGRSSYG